MTAASKASVKEALESKASLAWEAAQTALLSAREAALQALCSLESLRKASEHTGLTEADVETFIGELAGEVETVAQRFSEACQAYETFFRAKDNTESPVEASDRKRPGVAETKGWCYGCGQVHTYPVSKEEALHTLGGAFTPVTPEEASQVIGDKGQSRH